MKALQKWLTKNGMGTEWEDLDRQKADNALKTSNTFQPWDGDEPDDDDEYEADERLQR